MNQLEALHAKVRAQADEIQRLRDEKNRLKGEQTKPNIKPKAPPRQLSSEAERAVPVTWHKQAKIPQLHVDRELVVPLDPAERPVDADFKGYQRVIVQDNEDGSTGILYLVTSDRTLIYDAMTTLYRKRWNVEPYHKSLKQNASLERSPTHTVTTQTNHFFAALCGYIKLELLKGSTKLTHFALKAKLYTRALQAAFAALQELHPVRLAA